MPTEPIQNNTQNPETETEDPSHQLRIEVFHSPRNKDTDVSLTSDRIKRSINHPNTRLTNLRISVGHEASAIFATVVSKRWSHTELNDLARDITRHLEYEQYADETTVAEWSIDLS